MITFANRNFEVLATPAPNGHDFRARKDEGTALADALRYFAKKGEKGEWMTARCAGQSPFSGWNCKFFLYFAVYFADFL